MKAYPETGIEYLKIIRGKNKFIGGLKEEQKRIRELAVSISAPPPDKEKVSGGEVHGLETRVEKIDEYSRMIDEEYDELLTDLLTARRLISRMTNDEARFYVIAYYLLGASYEQIAKTYSVAKGTITKAMTDGGEEFNLIYEMAKRKGELS